MLTFDAVEHRYAWNGAPVPNVTRALDLLTDYSKIPAEVLELARQKGVAVHRMVELHAKNDLDEARLPAWMQPVIVQWKKFVFETGFKVLESERRVYHKRYRYAGTLDLFGTIHTGTAFVDVKRSFLAGRVIGMQIAAYEDAYYSEEGITRGKARRFALRLTEHSPYRVEEYDSKDDLYDYLTCLGFYRLKEKLQK